MDVDRGMVLRAHDINKLINRNVNSQEQEDGDVAYD